MNNWLEKVEAMEDIRKRKLVPSVEQEEELLQSARKRVEMMRRLKSTMIWLVGGIWTIHIKILY